VSDTPCEVWFYHLERSTLEQVLPELLEKTLARGWRARVRSADPSRIEALDAWLWIWRDDSFLAHGLAGEPFAERQPILFGQGGENVNRAQALFVLDGDAGDLACYLRCIVTFDDRQKPALQAARRLWSRYKMPATAPPTGARARSGGGLGKGDIVGLWLSRHDLPLPIRP
jgi:DNA polymerase-3 subunit chi